ncbi:hypothetical protein PR048_028337 [Dryococelus australis]|uniref:Uncharacterized protein n=1 Tax=Dryococelus australis TaxID=614101 RepID=A0ABQ9GIY9_9NEOP|nr:hypothetical protein PR048_028337 [Dryococelus australis]
MSDPPESELPKVDLSHEGLKYIADYVAYRFKNKHPLGDQSSDNNRIDYLSRGSLMTHSPELLEAIEISKEMFVAMHGDYFSKSKHVFNLLTNDIMSRTCNIPREAIHCFLSTRTNTRIREINRKTKNIEDEQRKSRNKMKKYM